MTNSERSKLYRIQLKKDLFSHYGNECVCCGENEILFLTFDHINNDGNVEKKDKKYQNSGFAFQLWIRRNNYPDHIQILCWNCNGGKRMNNGVCPHIKPQAL